MYRDYTIFILFFFLQCISNDLGRGSVDPSWRQTFSIVTFLAHDKGANYP